MSQESTSPFAITGAIKFTPIKPVNRGFERMLERFFSLRKLEGLYRQLPPSDDVGTFIRHSFKLLNVDYQVPGHERALIPTTGAVILVANHPFGGLDGLILAEMLGQLRSDVKIMANGLLQRLPELNELFIPVNPFGGKGAVRENLAPMREALRWLKKGGLLVVFPAGEVSNFNLRQRSVIDPPWASTVARLIRISNATVQPVYFHGCNSRTFQLAGLLHPVLRTVMLPRELVNKSKNTIQLRVGKPIPAAKLDSNWSDKALSDYLRWRTYLLRNEGDDACKAEPPEKVKMSEIVEPVPSALMAADISKISSESLLLESGEFQVFVGTAEQLPNIVREIGRLREVTFRATGEGTGRAIDLDLYDNYYLHLFVWNRDKQALIGAYRLGLVDQIVSRFGLKGLYSYSLFKYSNCLVNEINPAIELGRSFVRAEYQRSYSPLMLLWKGISAFVAKNPRYRKLFGPVSISNDYQASSQQLMVDFLRINNAFTTLAEQVKPRKAFRLSSQPVLGEGQMKDIEFKDLSALIAENECDNKGVPILIKQYLKMGGQILEFSVDRKFNNALDGLMMIDLLQTDAKVLAKYMGKQQIAQFLAYHTNGEERSA